MTGAAPPVPPTERATADGRTTGCPGERRHHVRGKAVALGVCATLAAASETLCDADAALEAERREHLLACLSRKVRVIQGGAGDGQVDSNPRANGRMTW